MTSSRNAKFDRLMDAIAETTEWAGVIDAWMGRPPEGDHLEAAAEDLALQNAEEQGRREEVDGLADAAGQAALASWERSRTTPFAGSEAKQAVTVAAYQAALAVLSLDPTTPEYTELTRALSVAVAFIAEMPAAE